jgi:hypothetical protein
LPGGGAAGGDDVGCHRTDVAGGICDGTLLTAHHEGQGSGLRPAHAAGHRGVHKAEAGGSSGVVQFLGRRDIDRGRVHQQRAGVGMGEDAVLAQVDRAGVLPFGQHGEHHVSAGDGLGNAAGRLDPTLLGGGERRGVEVEAADIVPGVRQVSGHETAHVAEADPADYCHVVSSFASDPASRAGRSVSTITPC